jgi:predicted ArsR family transcriptional regulator
MTSDAVRVVAALDDPQRARLYAFVRSRTVAVSREEAATAVGISRNLAAFHLDRLVDAGLLQASFARPVGGTRLGRLPKRYSPAPVELTVSIPERRYDLVGEILLDAVEGAGSAEAPVDAALRVAGERGRVAGAAVRERRRPGRLGVERAVALLSEVLAEHGFEPSVTPGCIELRNCPFDRLARRSPEVVCGINRAFVDGLLAGLEAPRLRAELCPAPGRCCVEVRSG